MKKFLILMACVLSFGMMHAQTVTLSGVVTSAADNQPMPGVSIVVMGTTIGTSTGGSEASDWRGIKLEMPGWGCMG